MKLIDIDAFRKEHNMSEKCTDCHRQTSECMYKYNLMDFCLWLDDAPIVNKWILVNEQLPEKGGYYLWCSKGGNVEKDFYWDGHWEKAEKYGYEVIAWMKLPNPIMIDI